MPDLTSELQQLRERAERAERRLARLWGDAGPVRDAGARLIKALAAIARHGHADECVHDDALKSAVGAARSAVDDLSTAAHEADRRAESSEAVRDYLRKRCATLEAALKTDGGVRDAITEYRRLRSIPDPFPGHRRLALSNIVGVAGERSERWVEVADDALSGGTAALDALLTAARIEVMREVVHSVECDVTVAEALYPMAVEARRDVLVSMRAMLERAGRGEPLRSTTPIGDARGDKS